MKLTLKLIIGASAISAMACSGQAQVAPITSTQDKTDKTDYTAGRTSNIQRSARLNDAAKASDIIGMTVKNYQDEKLGQVEDLAVDVESGRILQVVLSTGGFVGIGDTLIAVPPGAFHRDLTNNILHLDANLAKLKDAPKFEMSKWGEYSDTNHLARVYRHYGQESDLGFIGDPARHSQRTTLGEPNAVGRTEENRGLSDSQWMIPASRLGQVQKASKLMGTTVNNLQDEKLGKVENLLVDLPAGRVVAIVVSSGGFLGVGDELSAIPPTALRFTADRETLQLDASKEMLSSAPHFNANSWPDFAQPGYAGSVYNAYKVKPYFSDNTMTEADNTARNVRDRNDSNLTPLDQGTSQADRDITAQIRRQIVAHKDVSMNAKNVKIITIDGRVTLRGPVKTAEEKRLLGEIANRVAQSANVANELEVKLVPTGRD